MSAGKSWLAGIAALAVGVGAFVSVCVETNVPASGKTEQFPVDGDAVLAKLRELKDAKTLLNKLKVLSAIDALPDPRVAVLLEDYYGAILQPEWSLDSVISLRASLLRCIVRRLEKDEREKRLLRAVHEEVDAFREAQRQREAAFRSCELLETAVSLLDKGGVSESGVSRLRQWAADFKLPYSVRPCMKVPVIRFEMAREGVVEPAAISRYAIAHVPLRPRDGIPWDVYNVKARRMAYGETPQGKAQRDVFIKWRDSERATDTGAYEAILASCGVDAVEQIVAVLEKGEVERARRDYLAVVGSDILAGMPPANYTDARLGRLVPALVAHVDAMDDSGVGCNRNQAIMLLNIFYCKSGVKERHFFKEGGRIQATVMRRGEDSPIGMPNTQDTHPPAHQEQATISRP